MNEFTIIEKYLKPLSLNTKGSLKLSDDIFFDTKKGLAISLDTYVEKIHFLDPFDPNKFLKKILRASLSDLYCKGIKPNNYFLSFSLKKNLVKKNWLEKVKNILNSEQKKFNIHLSGGDITKSSKLVITVAVLGYCKNKPIFRSGANVNDDIYVTGNIVDSYIGLNILKKKMNFGSLNRFFLKKYHEPDLQVRFSSYLHKIANSAIDISDGLANDLRHLCINSQCGAFIDLNLIPLSKQSKFLLKNKKIKLRNIFSKGDDYQILFTSKPSNRPKIIALSKKTNTKISLIGVIKKDKNIIFKHNMEIFKLNTKKMGYIHNF